MHSTFAAITIAAIVSGVYAIVNQSCTREIIFRTCLLGGHMVKQLMEEILHQLM